MNPLICQQAEIIDQRIDLLVNGLNFAVQQIDLVDLFENFKNL